MHQVRYVLALRDSKNFTRAAEACSVTQPSLTRAIRRLEDELGGALFHRSRGGIRPTELGLMMLPHFEEIAARTAMALSAADNVRRNSQETLRLGVMCTIAPDPLISLFAAFTKQQPRVDLRITDLMANELEELLLANNLDVALYSPKRQENELLHYHNLFNEQMVIVLNSENALSKKVNVRAEDLRGQNYLYRLNCEYDDLSTRNSAFSMWSVAHRSDRDDWIVAMVAAGMGFGLLPACCVKHLGVVTRPLENPDLWRSISLVTVRGRHHSSAVGALVREAVRTKWDLSSPPPSQIS